MDEKQMFQLADPGPDPRASQEDDKADKDGKDTAPAVDPSDIVALQTQLNELQKHNRDLLRFIAQKPGVQVQVAEPGAEIPDVDLSGLPDPLAAPDEYRKQLSSRITAATRAAAKAGADAATKQTGQMLAVQGRRDKAWTVMRQKHADLAKHEKIIGVAATEYIQELAQRGVDADAMLAEDLDGFVDEVAQRAQNIVDDIAGSKTQEDDDDGRAQMLGAQTLGTDRGSRKSSKDQPGNFVQEIRKLQSDLHIY